MRSVGDKAVDIIMRVLLLHSVSATFTMTDLYSTRARRVILAVLVVVLASFLLRLYGLGFPVVCLKETRPKRRRAALWLEWQLPLLYTAISVSLFFRLLGFTVHFQTTFLLMSPYAVVGLRGICLPGGMQFEHSFLERRERRLRSGVALPGTTHTLKCRNCGAAETMSQKFLRCHGCQVVSAHYCSKTCQKVDWKRHKTECGKAPSTERHDWRGMIWWFWHVSGFLMCMLLIPACFFL